jgi:poly-beta-1,6-N-acetyl-D-glucosamine N-deacetylase
VSIIKIYYRSISYIIITIFILTSSMFQVYASILGEEIVNLNCQLPIIMYHNISNKSVVLGQWGITPKEFENDLKYIQQNGFTTVSMAEIIDFVYNGVPLPENPILLTFDDGDYGVYKYAFPLLQKYQMKGLFSIIGKVTDQYSSEDRQDLNYPNLTWIQIKEMIESGLIEIENHSYNLHGANGAKQLYGESDEEYSSRFSNDLVNLQERIFQMTGTCSNTFAYPLGKISKQSDDILLKLNFKASLSCYEKINELTVTDLNCLFSLGRILRPHNIDSHSFFKKAKN